MRFFAANPGSWISPPDPQPVDPATYVGDWGGGAVDLNYKSDRLHQFSLVLEKDFSGTVVSLGYVGSIGQRLTTEIGDVNYAPPNPSNVGINQRRPVYALNPNIRAVGAYYTNRGSSEYNAFQARITRRMKAGLTASASYAYAKALNDVRNLDSGGGALGYAFVPDQIRKYDWGPADTDMRHSAVATINYELPFGKSATGASKALLAGWQVNVLAFWRSGLPFQISAGQQVSHVSTNNAADKADVVPGQSLTVSNPTLQQWFNTAAFTTPAPGTIGNSGRNPLEGPATRRIDLSIFKSFDFGGSRRLQLRAECFNLTNTPNFGAPNNNLLSSSFGQITSGASNPRQIQFAAKFLF